MATIDDEGIRGVISEAIGTYPSFLAAREANVFVVPARDLAIEMASPLAPRLARTLIRVPWTSRIQYEDLEQAAMLGIIEGIDSFEPAKTYEDKRGKTHLVKPSTHLFWRIRKRVLEEVQDTHWIVAKPTRADIEAYMKNEMAPNEREAYIRAVLRPIDDPELVIHSSSHETRNVQGYLAAEGML